MTKKIKEEMDRRDKSRPFSEKQWIVDILRMTERRLLLEMKEARNWKECQAKQKDYFDTLRKLGFWWNAGTDIRQYMAFGHIPEIEVSDEK